MEKLGTQEAVKFMQEHLAGAEIKQSLKVTKANLDAFLALFDHAAQNEIELKFPGHFGTYFLDAAERVCKNPQTQEEVIVPAHTVVKVRVAEKLRKIAK